MKTSKPMPLFVCAGNTTPLTGLAKNQAAQKYKEYNKLRDVLSGKACPQTPPKRASNRPASGDADRTPKGQRTLATTPRKRKHEGEETALEATAPSKLLSPQGPAMIGPTPQRDGIVLGLFDLLPAGTPSKSRTALGEVVPNILQTPSKNANKVESETSFELRGRREKTPLSTGKKFLLEQFVTPKKRKLDEHGTPTLGLKEFSTPAFLRRDNFLTVVDEANESTPRPAPWKRRGLGRSLSTMIKSLKKQEEDRLDEEADIMRELEMEAEGIPVTKTARLPKVLVEDSQNTMPLGPDRGLESEGDDDEVADELDPDGKSKKVWKKKGLKRQTRRVISTSYTPRKICIANIRPVRPNFTKPKAPVAPTPHDDSEEERGRVTETQGTLNNPASDDEFAGNSDESDYASDNSHTPKRRKAQKKRSEHTSTSQPKVSIQGDEGPVKLAARKIKATAHANYRRLKIKSKGGNGGKGRFGRRR